VSARTSHRRIGLINAGGPIAAGSGDQLDLIGDEDHNIILTVERLLQRVPAIPGVDVVSIPFPTQPGAAIAPDDWLSLSALVRSAVDDDSIEGLVITLSTSTLEETAYFLSLTVRSDIPLVFVATQGLMNDGVGSDAPTKLLNALRVASARECVGIGGIVLHNNEIHSARDVSNLSTFGLHGFRSPYLGVLGYVSPHGKIALYRSTIRGAGRVSLFDVRNHESLPKVAITYSYAGADDAVIRAYIRQGFDGIVSTGFACGMGTSAEEAAFGEASRQGVLVIQASRGGTGRVVPRSVLRDSRVVVADSLTPQKARVLAILALTSTRDPQSIQKFFNEY